MMAFVDRRTVASMIDHTLLAPEATAADVRALCAEGVELGVAAVCVSARWVRVAAEAVDGALPVASVIGFPSGAHSAVVKALEARAAVADGASELDMVVPLGDVVAGDWEAVRHDIAAVRAASDQPVVLKVIIESGHLDGDTIDRVCAVAVDAGADYVKTSTGFHPSGGATLDAVARMRAAVGPDVGVKASGGIRDAPTARAMIDAGATRIGASATRSILEGFDRRGAG